MEKEDFFTIVSKQDIKENETLTIKKHNLDAEHLFVKQGYFDFNNPHNYFNLILGLDNEEYFEFYTAVQKKRKMFRRIHEFDLEFGRLRYEPNLELLKMLRVFFCENESMVGKQIQDFEREKKCHTQRY